jgi:hypothetical protein
VAQKSALQKLAHADEEDEDVLPEGVDPRWAALLKLRLEDKDQKAE